MKVPGKDTVHAYSILLLVLHDDVGSYIIVVADEGPVLQLLYDHTRRYSTAVPTKFSR